MIDNLQNVHSIQDRLYSNLYIFSDEDDNMEDIDKRYKGFSSGFKTFSKQKKKPNDSIDA